MKLDRIVIGAIEGGLYTFQNSNLVRLGSDPKKIAAQLKLLGVTASTELFGSSTMDFASEEGFKTDDCAIELLHDSMALI